MSVLLSFSFMVWVSLLLLKCSVQAYEEITARKHVIYQIPHANDTDENQKLIRRILTVKESLNIIECIQEFKSTIMTDDDLDFEAMTVRYIQCVEAELGIAKASRPDPVPRKWGKIDIKQTWDFTTTFYNPITSQAKQDIVTVGPRPWLRYRKEYNLSPRISKAEKSATQIQSKEEAPGCPNFNNLKSEIPIHRTLDTKTVEQRSVKISKSRSQSTEVKGQLSLSFKWLGLNAQGSQGESSQTSTADSTTITNTTSRKIEFDVPPNSVVRFSESTEYVKEESKINVPFQATGWLVDIEGSGNVVHDRVNDRIGFLPNSKYNLLLFPIGDMAFYFPEYMNRFSANSLAYFGPPTVVTSYRTEHRLKMTQYNYVPC